MRGLFYLRDGDTKKGSVESRTKKRQFKNNTSEKCSDQIIRHHRSYKALNESRYNEAGDSLMLLFGGCNDPVEETGIIATGS